jgi:hypothetical protein
VPAQRADLTDSISSGLTSPSVGAALLSASSDSIALTSA